MSLISCYFELPFKDLFDFMLTLSNYRYFSIITKNGSSGHGVLCLATKEDREGKEVSVEVI